MTRRIFAARVRHNSEPSPRQRSFRGGGYRPSAAALGASLCLNMACQAIANVERAAPDPAHDAGADERNEGSDDTTSMRPESLDGGAPAQPRTNAGGAGGESDANACAEGAACDAGASPPAADTACGSADGGCLPPCDGCRIGGACVRQGSPHPDNVCLVCDAGRDAENWSSNDGIICDDQRFCTELAACSEGECRRVLARDCGFDSCSEVRRACVCSGDC